MPRKTDCGPVDDEQRGLDLAGQLELSVHGEKAVVVVLAGCWLLATVIVQALERDGDDADPIQAVVAVTQQLCNCVSQLRVSRAMTKQ